MIVLVLFGLLDYRISLSCAAREFSASRTTCVRHAHRAGARGCA
jgi:hypothetical protein